MPTFLDVLNKLWPHGDSKVPGLRAGIAASAPAVFRKYGLTSNLLIAHFTAQASHECGAGLEMVENINYSATRACAVWPSRFISAADCYAKCDSFEGDPQFSIKLIDHVYGGRMGNAPYPSHDGSTYIGRGLSQVTGKEGYQKLAAKTGLDLIGNPRLLSTPRYALECGVADFILCGCLPYAQADDVVGVTKKLNGGTIGLAEREAWLNKWKSALQGVDVLMPVVVAPPDVEPVPPKPAPQPPIIHPKHTVGIITFVTGIVAALSSSKIEIAIGAVIVAVIVAVAVHFLWPKKGPTP